MQTETIFVVQQTGYGIVGASTTSEGTTQVGLPDKGKPFGVTTTQLHRPDLRPIYGGPTLLEALWSEMDRLMEALMTGAEAEDICGRESCSGDPDRPGKCGHPDNGDKYRAQELAWVLAIVSNPYAPSVDAIRREAMERWNAQREAADEARSERESLQFEAHGVNGYEL